MPLIIALWVFIGTLTYWFGIVAAFAFLGALLVACTGIITFWILVVAAFKWWPNRRKEKPPVRP